MNRKQYTERHKITESDFNEAKKIVRDILINSTQNVNTHIDEMKELVQSFQKTDQQRKQKIYKKVRVAQAERRILRHLRKIAWHMHLNKTDCDAYDEI